jgi:hypothetical protein
MNYHKWNYIHAGWNPKAVERAWNIVADGSGAEEIMYVNTGIILIDSLVLGDRDTGRQRHSGGELDMGDNGGGGGEVYTA